MGQPPPPCGAPPQGPPAIFKIWVQSGEAGRVIGKGGESVRELMSRSGCEISVERSDGTESSQSERLITLSGAPPHISNAFSEIARDVSYVRGEKGVIKASGMSSEEAEVALRAFGPSSLAMPYGMPVMMGMPPGMPPPPPGMPPMGALPMGMPPPPGMPPMMTHPPGGTFANAASSPSGQEASAAGADFAAPWTASRP